MPKATAIDKAIASLREKLAPLEQQADGYRKAIQALEHAQVAKKASTRTKPRAVPTGDAA